METLFLLRVEDMKIKASGSFETSVFINTHRSTVQQTVNLTNCIWRFAAEYAKSKTILRCAQCGKPCVEEVWTCYKRSVAVVCTALEITLWTKTVPHIKYFHRGNTTSIRDLIVLVNMGTSRDVQKKKLLIFFFFCFNDTLKCNQFYSDLEVI